MNNLTFCDEENIQLGRKTELIEEYPQHSLLDEDLYLFHKKIPFIRSFLINQYDELGITIQEENPSSLYYNYFVYHQNTSDTVSSLQEETFKRNIIRKAEIQEYPKQHYPYLNIIRYFSAISNVSDITNPHDIKIMLCTRRYNIKKEESRNEEKIVEKLSDISTRLKKVTHYLEKLQILDELNDFLSKHEDQIKKKFSDKLVSILNSL